MDQIAIFLTVLAVSFFQILHIFEEIALNIYDLIKNRNPKGTYLRVASFLVFLNYVILGLLYLDYKIAYYLAFYSVIISIGNMIAHLYQILKNKKNLGYGFPSSLPLGLTGVFLLWLLVQYHGMPV